MSRGNAPFGGGGRGGGGFGEGGPGGVRYLGLPGDEKARGDNGAELADAPADGAAGSSAEPKGREQQTEAKARALRPEQLDRLAQVLDARLLVAALAALVDDTEALRTLVAELAVPTTGEGEQLAFAVVIKVDRASQAQTLDALRAAGVAIEAEDASRGLVVARVPSAALPRVALVEGVRRIASQPVGQ